MGDLERASTGGDPQSMRISDADRHAVAELLRRAAGEGRLDLAELDERLSWTYAAKTYGDLVPITADLHAAGHPATGPVPPPLPDAVPATTHGSSTAIMSGRTRRGVWHVPASHSAFSLMGGVTLDLREAVMMVRETTINASTIMGEIKIIIPAHMHAVVDGTPIMGEYGQAKDRVPADLGPHSPIIKVQGMALMGSVTVVRLPPPGTPRTFIGTY